MLDLRGNPGGILDQALSISNLFLKQGQEIASVRGRNTEPQTYVAREQPIAPDIPLVVLTEPVHGVRLGDRRRRAAGPRPRA